MEVERFEEFFNQFYEKELLVAAAQGKKSFIVDFNLLDKFDPNLADKLLNDPEPILDAARKAVFSIDLPEGPVKLEPRFKNLPEQQNIRIRNLRSEHIGKFLCLDGVVRRASEVKPEVSEATFDCPDCGSKIKVIQTERFLTPPSMCECGRKGNFKAIDRKLFDARWIFIEEPFEIVTGERPGEVSVYLKEDLTSPEMQRKTDPGNRVKVNGIIKEIRKIFRGRMKTQMDIYVEANYVEPAEIEWEEVDITREDEEKIKNLAKDPEVYNKLVASIAPSIYGMDKIKEAITLQLFGGVPHNLPDKTRIRGDIHVLLVGDPSTGKSQLLKLISSIIPRGKYVGGRAATAAGLCVSPETLVLLEDGSFQEIGKIVDYELEKGSVQIKNGIEVARNPTQKKLLAFDTKEIKIRPLNISQYWKIKSPKKIIKIKTRTGREVKVTLENPLPLIQNGFVVWKKASELQKGDFIAVPREIIYEPKESEVSIFNFLDKTAHLINANEIVDLLVTKIKENSTIRDFSRECNINENLLYHPWRNGGQSPALFTLEKLCEKLSLNLEDLLPDKMRLMQCNGHTITLSKNLTEDLLYIMGLIAGDGSVSKTGYGDFSIKLHSASEELLETFKNICKIQIGLDSYYYKHTKKIPYRNINSKIVGNILLKFGIPYGKKSHKLKIADELSKLPNKFVRVYLQGVFDTGSSSIKRKKSASYIDLTSSSKEFIIGVQLLLLRFSILSKIRKREKSISYIRGKKVKSDVKYVLEIKGLDNLKKFKENIGFRLNRKLKKLENIIASISKVHSNIDLIPGISEILKKTRKELGMSSKELFGYNGYVYEKGLRSPTRKMLQKIVNKMKEKGATENLKHLEKLAFSDILIDKIIEIKIVDSDFDYVYDLTVEGEHSFIANGLFVHNTATVTKDEEFGGGWMLEAGAMVLSNRGVLAVDEFDKMSKEDQVAMHEALEQQQISIAKASIVATLPAQVSVLAGSNPKFFRFDPYRSIAEQVDIPDTLLSIDGKEPILIRENGIAKIEKIEDIVDKYCKQSDVPIFISDRLDAAAFNYRMYKTEWWPIKYVFRHRIKENLFKLTLDSGREIKLSKGHSVFVFENCEIKTKTSDDIRVGDYVIIPRKLPINDIGLKEINLVRELLKLPEEDIGNIFLHNVPKEILEKLKIKDRNWIYGKKLPLRFAEKVSDKDIKRCELKYKGSRVGTKTIIPVNKDLIRLLSYYVAKGSLFISTSSEHLLSLSFNRNETSLINDVKKISKKLFNQDASLIKDKNEIKVNITNKIVYLLFDKILKVTKHAENKRIPTIVFNVKPSLQKEFIRAYHAGNYCVSVSKDMLSDLLYLFLQNNAIVSVNKTNPYEAIFPDGHKALCKISYKLVDAENKVKDFRSVKKYTWIPIKLVKDVLISISQKKYKGNYYGSKKAAKYITKVLWKNIIQRKNITKLLERMTKLVEPSTVDNFTKVIYRITKDNKSFRLKKESIRPYLNKWVNRGLVKKEIINGLYVYSLSQKGKDILEKIRMIEKLLSADIGLAKVKRIESIKPTGSYVYDVSTPGHENFVAGFGGILCHNSRFDIKFALKDIPDKEKDEKLATHILETRLQPTRVTPEIAPEFLRKYIAYAKKNCKPEMTREAAEKIKNFYLDMRSLYAGETLAITLRQNEALMRISEASAKIRLSDKVEVQDAERAIDIVKFSLQELGYDYETGKIDIDRTEGVSASQRSKIHTMLDLIERLEKQIGKQIPKEEIIATAQDEGMKEVDAEDLLNRLKREGMIFEPKPNFIQKI